MAFEARAARARDARVHFDDDHAAVFRMNGELNVRSARFNADGANDPRSIGREDFDTRDRSSVCAGATVIESPVCTPIGSKFSIEQTMMTVVIFVANDLELKFFPADEAFFDEHVVRGRERRARARRFSRNSLFGVARCRRLRRRE